MLARPRARAGTLARAASAVAAVLGAPAATAETVVDDATVTASIEAACTVTGDVLDFGHYNPQDTDPIRGVAAITLDCPEGAEVTVRLDGGANLAGGDRRMAGGRDEFLRYNLYIDRHRTLVWGDGVALGDPVTITYHADNPRRTVFGLLPAGQDVTPGAYSDTVTITVEVNAAP